MEYLFIFLTGLIDIAKNYVGTQNLFELLGESEIKAIINRIPKLPLASQELFLSLVDDSQSIEYQAKCFIVAGLAEYKFYIPETKQIPATDKDTIISNFVGLTASNRKVPQGITFLHKYLFSHILHNRDLDTCASILNLKNTPTTSLETTILVAWSYQYHIIQIAKLSLK